MKTLLLVVLLSVLSANVFSLDMGKSGTGIRIVAPKELSVEPGQNHATVINFSSVGFSGAVAIELKVPEGVELVGNSQTKWYFSSSEKIEVPLRFVAENNGRYHLMFSVSREMYGREFYSTTGVVVQAGAAAALQKTASSDAEKSGYALLSVLFYDAH